MPNSTYSTALSVTTLDDFSADIWNLIIGQNQITRYFDQLGFVKRYSGGANVTKRLNYAENSTFGTISAYESVDLSPQEPFTAAVFAWKIIAGAVSLANLVIAQNSGDKHQISNIMKDLLKVAATTGVLELSRQLWKDGTGNGGKDFGGIRLINQTSAGQGSVGGIDSSTDTWWANQYQASVGSFAANGVYYLDSVRINCQRNNTSPINKGLVVGETSTVLAYEQTALQMKRFVQSNKEAYDLGLPNVEYAGMPMIFDPNQTAGYIDILNPDTLELALLTDMDYKKSAMTSPVDQDVKTQMMVLYGNLACTDRSTNGLLYGVTYP